MSLSIFIGGGEGESLKPNVSKGKYEAKLEFSEGVTKITEQ